MHFALKNVSNENQINKQNKKDFLRLFLFLVYVIFSQKVNSVAPSSWCLRMNMIMTWKMMVAIKGSLCVGCVWKNYAGKCDYRIPKHLKEFMQLGCIKKD